MSSNSDKILVLFGNCDFHSIPSVKTTHLVFIVVTFQYIYSYCYPRYTFTQLLSGALCFKLHASRYDTVKPFHYTGFLFSFFSSDSIHMICPFLVHSINFVYALVFKFKFLWLEVQSQATGNLFFSIFLQKYPLSLLHF